MHLNQATKLKRARKIGPASTRQHFNGPAKLVNVTINLKGRPYMQEYKILAKKFNHSISTEKKPATPEEKLDSLLMSRPIDCFCFCRFLLNDNENPTLIFSNNSVFRTHIIIGFVTSGVRRSLVCSLESGIYFPNDIMNHLEHTIPFDFLSENSYRDRALRNGYECEQWLLYKSSSYIDLFIFNVSYCRKPFWRSTFIEKTRPEFAKTFYTLFQEELKNNFLTKHYTPNLLDTRKEGSLSFETWPLETYYSNFYKKMRLFKFLYPGYTDTRSGPIRELMPTITPKEIECCKLLLEYYQTKEIAYIQGVKEKTIRKHIENLTKKLNCNTRSNLLRCLSQLVVD